MSDHEKILLANFKHRIADMETKSLSIATLLFDNVEKSSQSTIEIIWNQIKFPYFKYFIKCKTNMFFKVTEMTIYSIDNIKLNIKNEIKKSINETPHCPIHYTLYFDLDGPYSKINIMVLNELKEEGIYHQSETGGNLSVVRKPFSFWASNKYKP